MIKRDIQSPEANTKHGFALGLAWLARLGLLLAGEYLGVEEFLAGFPRSFIYCLFALTPPPFLTLRRGAEANCTCTYISSTLLPYLSVLS